MAWTVTQNRSSIVIRREPTRHRNWTKRYLGKDAHCVKTEEECSGQESHCVNTIEERTGQKSALCQHHRVTHLVELLIVSTL